MIEIERTFTIHRPVEEVFAYLCDIEHGPSYTSGQREAHQTSTGPLGIGTTFATSGKFPRRGSRYEITEYERDRRLTWKSASGAPTTTTWAFQPAGPSTRITFTRVAEAFRLDRFPSAGVARTEARQLRDRSGRGHTQGTAGGHPQADSERLVTSDDHHNQAARRPSGCQAQAQG